MTLREAAEAFVAETNAKPREWAEIVTDLPQHVVVDAGRINFCTGAKERAIQSRVFRFEGGKIIHVDSWHP